MDTLPEVEWQQDVRRIAVPSVIRVASVVTEVEPAGLLAEVSVAHPAGLLVRILWADEVRSAALVVAALEALAEEVTEEATGEVTAEIKRSTSGEGPRRSFFSYPSPAGS